MFIWQDQKWNLISNKKAIEGPPAIKPGHQGVEVYFDGDNVSCSLKESKEGIKNYTKAIKLNPQDARAYFNRGNMNYNLENYKEAVEDYTKAIKLNPQYAEAYCGRGLANSNLGDHEEAIKYYKRAIKNYDKAKTLFEKEGNKAMVKRCEEAIEDYNKAIELDSQDAEAYCGRGLANSNLGDHEEAIKNCIKAKELFEKEENKEIVETCEEMIEELKKLIAKADER